MLSLNEAGTFFIASRQGGIRLETEGIPASGWGQNHDINASSRDDFENKNFQSYYVTKNSQ